MIVTSTRRKALTIALVTKDRAKILQFFVQIFSRRDGGKLIRNSDKNLKGDCPGNFGPCFAPASHGQNNPLLSPSTLLLRH